ncbi:MAG TPA: type I-E CRISPR-associated protein Cas6/Cse3/CasE [Deltaproteobacteria bacterium]|nr:type I-E CRISPR-associated protein Cas6/Cse3/CasE [Deltaproteobacteria bacterium]
MSKEGSMFEDRKMYLSRVRALAEKPAKLIRILRADNYSLHKMMWSLFPDNPHAKRDFLFRKDIQHGWPVFYALSPRQPVPVIGVFDVETKVFSPKLRAGDRLAFTLRANPVQTRKTGDPNPKKRKRDDVVMRLKRELRAKKNPEDKTPSQSELIQKTGEEWLRRQAAKRGFKVETVGVDGYQQHIFYSKSRKIHFSSLDFNGILEVTNTDKFLDTLYFGIGPAKAFGCGLMLISRANKTAY